jgi:hypothetical protein
VQARRPKAPARLCRCDKRNSFLIARASPAGLSCLASPPRYLPALLSGGAAVNHGQEAGARPAAECSFGLRSNRTNGTGTRGTAIHAAFRRQQCGIGLRSNRTVGKGTGRTAIHAATSVPENSGPTQQRANTDIGRQHKRHQKFCWELHQGQSDDRLAIRLSGEVETFARCAAPGRARRRVEKTSETKGTSPRARPAG